MDCATMGRVERARQYLLSSSLNEDTKDNLQSLLDLAAEAANGHPDKLQAIADAMLALAIHEAKQAVRAPERLHAAVADEMQRHVAACPLRGVSGAMPRWMTMLYPFRWQVAIVLAVAAFSPQAPRIAAAIGAMTK